MFVNHLLTSYIRVGFREQIFLEDTSVTLKKYLVKESETKHCDRLCHLYNSKFSRKSTPWISRSQDLCFCSLEKSKEKHLAGADIDFLS